VKSTEVKEKYKIWLMTDPKKRKPRTKAAFGRQHDVTPQTLNRWENEKPEEPVGDEGEYNSINYLLNQLKEADGALVRSCLAGNATAQKVLRQILGQLSDKGDNGDGDGYSAEEIAGIRNQAKRELEAEGFTVEGSGKVRPEPPLLSQDLREN